MEKKSQLDKKIIDGLEKLSRVLRNQMWQTSHPLKLTPIQARILNLTLREREGKVNNSFLADELIVSRATITDSLNLLQKKELISIVKNENDKRSSTINLTATGKAIAKETNNYSEEILEHFESLKKKSKENLYSSLLDIIQSFNESGVIASQRMCFSCDYYSKKSGDHYCGFLESQLNLEDLNLNCPDHKNES